MNNKGHSHEAEEQSTTSYFCQVKAATFSRAKKVNLTCQSNQHGTFFISPYFYLTATTELLTTDRQPRGHIATTVA